MRSQQAEIQMHGCARILKKEPDLLHNKGETCPEIVQLSSRGGMQVAFFEKFCLVSILKKKPGLLHNKGETCP